jgi:uncharacterized heparinase superfamily protein
VQPLPLQQVLQLCLQRLHAKPRACETSRRCRVACVCARDKLCVHARVAWRTQCSTQALERAFGDRMADAQRARLTQSASLCAFEGPGAMKDECKRRRLRDERAESLRALKARGYQRLQAGGGGNTAMGHTVPAAAADAWEQTHSAVREVAPTPPF